MAAGSQTRVPPRPPAPWEWLPAPWEFLQQATGQSPEPYLELLAQFPDDWTVRQAKEHVQKQFAPQENPKSGDSPHSTPGGRGYRAAGSAGGSRPAQPDADASVPLRRKARFA